MYVVVVGVSAAVAILWREGEGEGREGGRQQLYNTRFHILTQPTLQAVNTVMLREQCVS